MGALVQAILVGGLLVCLGVAAVVFARLFREPQGARVLIQVLGINCCLWLIILAATYALDRSLRFPELLIISGIYTLFANIPLAVIAKVIDIFSRRNSP